MYKKSALSQTLGIAAEALFCNCLQKGNHQYAASTYYENTQRHIDIYMINHPQLQKARVGVDIKGLKRLSTISHLQCKPQSKLMFVELEAAGKPNTKSGWLYDGAADYIAFQLDAKDDTVAQSNNNNNNNNDDNNNNAKNSTKVFLMVDRIELLHLVDSNKDIHTQTTLHSHQAVYKKYTRICQNMHRGAITLIPECDLRALKQSKIMNAHGFFI